MVSSKTKVIYLYELAYRMPESDQKKFLRKAATSVERKQESKFLKEVFSHAENLFLDTYSSERLARKIGADPENKGRLNLLRSKAYNYLKLLIREQVGEQSLFGRKLHLLFYLSQIKAEFCFTHEFKRLFRDVSKMKEGEEKYHALYEIRKVNLVHEVSAGSRENSKSYAAVLDAEQKLSDFRRLYLLCAKVNSQVANGEFPVLEMPLAYSTPDPKSQGNDHLLVVLESIYACHLKADQGKVHYLQAKELLMDHREGFEKQIAMDCLNHMLNYGSRRLNQGDDNFISEMKTNYQWGMESGLLLDLDGNANVWNVHNMINLAHRMNDNPWLETIGRQYLPLLSTADQHPIQEYWQGVLAFDNQQYQETISCMHQVFKAKGDIYRELDARIFLLKAYFELRLQGEIEVEELTELESLKDTFRMNVSRSKRIPEKHRENYLNFARLFLRLNNLDVPERKRLNRIKEKAEALSLVTDKKWIISKIEYLLGLIPD